MRVYFEDTDFSGVVYHGGYIRFMERGRSDFLRLLGIGHDALDRAASMASRSPSPCAGSPPTSSDRRGSTTCWRSKPGRREIGGARIVLSQTVRRGDDVLVKAEVTVVMINGAGEARRLPDAVRAVLRRRGHCLTLG